jgi:FAD/FMN-containing dehydrogenase
MVINLERFQTVQVNNTTGIAEVGGGVRIGNLAQHIYDQGKRALSHGTCPGVGIGGHFTHGGYGHTSRHWGIALDSIVAAEVVLADGTLVTAYPSGRYKDVFWAIRGAADAIGVVTKFYLKTEAAPADGAITYFSLQWQGVFNGTREDFVKSFLHIQDFATNATVVDDRISFGIVSVDPHEALRSHGVTAR